MPSIIWNNPFKLSEWVNDKKRVVNQGIALCHGVFDILHEGHLQQFAKAKEIAPYVIVSVTPDIHVGKGPNRPINTQTKRAALVAQQANVDGVVLNDTANACKVIECLRPQFYLKGIEYKGQTGAFALELKSLKKGRGEVVYTDMIDSSTRLSSYIDKEYPQDFLEWISSYDVRKEIDNTTEWIEIARKAQFLIAGEQITDEYVWVEPMGRSAKEAIVAWKETGRETYQGGSDALISHMKASGTFYRAWYGGYKDIVKTRFVEKPFMRKVFESTTWKPSFHVDRGSVESCINECLLVADFGHGMFDKSLASALPKLTAFLALTCQTNAMNQGFNSLHKWSGADYVVVDENELRLAWQDQHSDITVLMEKEIIRMSLRTLAVTQGHLGVTLMSCHNFQTQRIPVVSSHAVDRMGAGDAFLAWTAPLAFVNAPLSVIGLVGNIAGAIQVGIVGNSRPVTKEDISKSLDKILF